MDKAIILVIFVNAPMVNSALPGTFFWKPRLGLDFVPPLPAPRLIEPPLRKSIQQGLVVILEGYSIGVTVLALAAGYHASSTPFKHLSIWHAPFYTNAYRWGLRHINLLPYWMSGSASRYPDTLKLWRRRYYYMDEFVPKWIRHLIFWVNKNEWKEEESEFKSYIRFAEPAFGKHFRYPEKIFKNYISQMTEETVENLLTVEETTKEGAKSSKQG